MHFSSRIGPVECDRQTFLSFWTVFCTFTPFNNLKNENFEKMKKYPRDIIIFHMCTINANHMMYGSWDIDHDGQNFLLFWTIFCPFTLQRTQKIKILKKCKKKKKPGDIIILHKCVINGNHMMYGSWDMKHDGQNFFVILDYFLPFYLTNNLKNQNLGKVKKMPGDIIISHKFTKNHDHKLYCSLDMVCNRCNCYFSFWAIFCPFTSLTAQKKQNNKKRKKTPGDIII